MNRGGEQGLRLIKILYPESLLEDQIPGEAESETRTAPEKPGRIIVISFFCVLYGLDDPIL
jgi:hypothetical protein